MISFEKKNDPRPLREGVGDNRFEQIREAAAETRRKSDSKATRRDRQKADDNRLL